MNRKPKRLTSGILLGLTLTSIHAAQARVQLYIQEHPAPNPLLSAAPQTGAQPIPPPPSASPYPVYAQPPVAAPSPIYIIYPGQPGTPQAPHLPHVSAPGNGEPGQILVPNAQGQVIQLAAPATQATRNEERGFLSAFAPGDGSRGPYFQLNAGVGFVHDQTNTSGGFRGERNIDPGYVVSGAVGYRLHPNFRLEVEASFASFEYDGQSEATGRVISFPDGDAELGLNSIRSTATGVLDFLSVTVNGYYDFNARGRLRPYVGAGLGVTRVTSRDVEIRIRDEIVSGFLQERDYFTSLAEFGLEIKLTDRFSIVPAYRFQWVDFPTGFDDALIHQLRAGLRVQF